MSLDVIEGLEERIGYYEAVLDRIVIEGKTVDEIKKWAISALPDGHFVLAAGEVQ